MLKMEKLMTRKGYEKIARRVAELEVEVSKIESQVGVVTTQSSETWHDNAPYSVLVEELRVADRRLSDAINDARGGKFVEYPTRIVDPIVGYGTRVLFERDGENFDFSIVGFGDSDIDKGRILYRTPIAQILMGRREGERFSDSVNGNSFEFYIKRVEALGDLD